jgi:hypothetical protein
VRKPALFAKCLQLLFCCLEPPLTCELVFSLLQPGNESYGQLLPHLGQLLVESLPGGKAPATMAQTDPRYVFTTLLGCAKFLAARFLSSRCRRTEVLVATLA